MKIKLTNRFEKQYAALIRDDRLLRSSVQKTLTYLLDFPPAHPSLRIKRIQGTDGVYECSVNMDVRITFEFIAGETILLRNVDHHDQALKRP
uniref:type II toxin-antitoxin system RelE/ParE family toxin n=1 Tax=Alicyclobacillus tolerans TaxID=90970 RepID=UPI0035585AB3